MDKKKYPNFIGIYFNDRIFELDGWILPTNDWYDAARKSYASHIIIFLESLGKELENNIGTYRDIDDGKIYSDKSQYMRYNYFTNENTSISNTAEYTYAKFVDDVEIVTCHWYLRSLFPYFANARNEKNAEINEIKKN